MALVELTAENFDEVVNTDGKVLVDFWAEWCGPCRLMNPVLKEFSEKHQDITVGKLDISENSELTGKYNVRSIPTLILFENGEPVETSIGSMHLAEIEEKFLGDV